MSPPTKPPNARPCEIDVRETPLYWFGVMDMAVARGGFERALAAQRELERLGVTVRYGRPKKGGPRRAS